MKITETLTHRWFEIDASEVHAVALHDERRREHKFVLGCWCAPNLWASSHEGRYIVMHRHGPGVRPNGSKGCRWRQGD